MLALVCSDNKLINSCRIGILHTQALGLPYGLLLPPHRLDAGTEGVVVLAKSTAVARRLKELFDHKGVVSAFHKACVRSVTRTGLLSWAHTFYAGTMLLASMHAAVCLNAGQNKRC